jgi:hypothetical protein
MDLYHSILRNFKEKRLFMRWSLIITFSICLDMSGSLIAQQVTFCEPYSDRFTVKEEMLGRVGEYYWVSMTTRRKGRHAADAEDGQSFVIYDGRMAPVNEISNFYCPGEVLKEYLINGQEHFDQVYLSAARNRKIGIWLQRYTPDGQREGEGEVIGSFPFYEPGTSFLLVRSQDRNLYLLLGFETVSGSTPRVHALVFDADWRLVSTKVYNHSFLTQPMIQDDFTGYPLEDFDKGPVKLANNGEWLMISPSRTSTNYLLSHFNANDTAVAWREIALPSIATVDDMDLSVDNARAEASAGILSDFHYNTLKNVRVIHYSMAAKTFDFDTSYQLTTLGGKKIRNENMVKENFLAVPGRGFLLLKEYGRLYEEDIDQTSYDDGFDPMSLLADNNIDDPMTPGKGVRLKLPAPRYGYARYPLLVNPVNHDRGDLSLYYFPGYRGDSCWSGMISEEQVTELNAPNLSYAVVPVQDKLFCLYNSFVKNENMYAVSTVLNGQGRLISDQGVLFWGLKNTLDFQRLRQVAPDQVVIPYIHYGKPAFAVVALNAPTR